MARAMKGVCIFEARERTILAIRLHLKSRFAQGGAPFSWAPSMGAFLRVQVPSQVDHDERSEAQLHEGDRMWEGSVEHKLRADEQEPDRRHCQAGRAGKIPRSSCDQGEAV
jgi:hypothetical protein